MPPTATEMPPTARSLLSAARPLFAHHGYDGTSIREITRAASVNLGAVTYHFGSKRKLYEAVVADAAAGLPERMSEEARGEGSALDRLEAALHILFSHMRDNPDIPELLFQEVAAGREPPAPVHEILQALVEEVAELVRQGKAYGSIEAGDPYLSASSIVSQTLSFTLLQRALSAGESGRSRQRSAGSIEGHAVRFLRRALAS